jgi:hypothetical protein
LTTSFRGPLTVIKRDMGIWHEGIYIPDDDRGRQTTIMATVLEPSPGDMNRIDPTPYGRRAARYIKIYTDERLKPVSQARSGDGYPGDLVLYDGAEYLLFGESNFTTLRRTRSTPVSHWRYYACEVIEGAGMEGAP